MPSTLVDVQIIPIFVVVAVAHSLARHRVLLIIDIESQSPTSEPERMGPQSSRSTVACTRELRLPKPSRSPAEWNREPLGRGSITAVGEDDAIGAPGHPGPGAIANLWGRRHEARVASA